MCRLWPRYFLYWWGWPSFVLRTCWASAPLFQLPYGHRAFASCCFPNTLAWCSVANDLSPFVVMANADISADVGFTEFALPASSFNEPGRDRILHLLFPIKKRQQYAGGVCEGFRDHK